MLAVPPPLDVAEVGTLCRASSLYLRGLGHAASTKRKIEALHGENKKFETGIGEGGETHQRIPKGDSHSAEGHLTTN
jgi:hypothetical protein